MKKVLATIILPVMVLSLSHLAAGQGDSNSLDNELVVAAEKGDTAAVQQLLQKGANVEARDSGGGTALLWAAEGGYTEVAKLLLDKGANINAKDSKGTTALLQAVEQNSAELVKLLLERGANIEAGDGGGGTALLRAAFGGNIAILQLLLDKGANVNAQFNTGETALHTMALNGRTEVVKILLKRGANTEIKDKLGETPLMVAAQWGKAEVAKQLLDGGAKIEARDDEGQTALHVAAHRGRSEEVRLLLDKGANIEARDNDGFTPLLCAAEAGGTIFFKQQGADIVKYPAVDVVNLLLDRGANLEAKSNWGQTALHRAAFRGRPDVVKLLLDKGANIQAMDNHGNTALNLARASLRNWERIAGESGNPSPGGRQIAEKTLSDKAEVVRLLEQALAQHPPADFAEYVRDLQNHPRDRARRDHVVELAAALPTLPPIPENAQQRYDRASALIQQASRPQQLDEAMNLLRGALNVAPWWRDAYFQLSRALERTGQYDLAVKNLNYYLELHPPEAEAREARTHLAEILVEKETAAGKTQ